jgi:phospholipid/cholesterol/gamma-HCH transport system substrate-binding protein
MQTDKHYLMVGSFVILTLLAAAVFSVWLTGKHDQDKYMLYRIHFTESVNGLTIGGPVKLRGVDVGVIKNMMIDPSDTSQVRIDVNLLKTAPIKTDTVATLKLQGITGGTYIELSGSSPEAAILANNQENDADHPPEIPSEPSTISTLMEMLPEITDKISHISGQIDKLLSNKNIASLSDTIKNFQQASHNTNELTHNIKEHPSQLIFGSRKKDDE